MIVRGQVHGGVAQGVGQAVLEHTVYDPDSGQLLSGSFMDYALPRAADLPDIEVELIEVPCATNPLGREGRGRGRRGRQPARRDERDRRRAGASAGVTPARHAGDARAGVAGAGDGAGGVASVRQRLRRIEMGRWRKPQPRAECPAPARRSAGAWMRPRP